MIEVKKIVYLPWLRGLNARVLNPGETIAVVEEKFEGVYRWVITATDSGTITSHTRPYKLTDNGQMIYGQEETSQARLTVHEEINHFGPQNRPWRSKP